MILDINSKRCERERLPRGTGIVHSWLPNQPGKDASMANESCDATTVAIGVVVVFSYMYFNENLDFCPFFPEAHRDTGSSVQS
ncbi:hypothetical protein I79_008592 [Cricetulus griseus]|uniref:Uncharacterized protein n=1 Tax=Cricetulus griseus TaxID=10029 RepID=G3HDK9_CRIGR|nr:hypothetical protein I79_008592 [Cricetulus griseus]